MSAVSTSSLPEIPLDPRPSLLRRWFNADAIAHFIVWLAAAAIVALTAAIVYELWISSSLARKEFGWRFLISQEWDPVAGVYGALPFLYGTLVTSAIALIIAVPLGIGCAIFLAELAPAKISNALTFLIELLAAVPSVIYGLLGVFVLLPILTSTVVPALKSTLGFLPIFSGAFYGVSFFTAGVVLSIMIVPFIVSVSREVLLAVPNEQREGSLALGATRWETTWKVVLPFAKKGILGSIFLALARALGETMAVTMVIGNSPQIVKSLLAPGYTTAAVIANEFTEATDDMYISALIMLALVLFGLTIVVNALARLLVLTTTRRGAK
jgi:phosphate transport system permease protein